MWYIYLKKSFYIKIISKQKFQWLKIMLLKKNQFVLD